MLKFIALLLMIVDHLGASLFPDILFLRIIGRLSFPIFAFSLVEGYIHTKNIQNYFKRLLIFSSASMIPFALLFGGYKSTYVAFQVFTHMPLKMFIGHLDIGFTFCLGLVSLKIVDRIRVNKYNPVNYIWIATTLVTANVLGVDYGIFGVLTILAFYVFKNNNILLTAIFCLLPVTMMNFNEPSAMFFMEFASVLSLPLIFYLKDRELNKKCILPRNFFYVFYPVHLFLLWILRCILA